MAESINADYNLSYLTFLVISILINSFLFGYALACLNPIIDVIVVVFHWDSPELKSRKNLYIGILTFLIPFGAAISSFLTGFIVKKGRRYSIFVMDSLIIVGGILSIVEVSEILFIGRLLIGFGIGIGATSCPMIIREISPVQISGKLGSFNQLIVTLGICTPIIISLLKPSPANYQVTIFWKIIFGIPILVSIIQGIIFLLVFRNDTPKFYLSINEDEKAILALKNIYHNQSEINKVYNDLKILSNNEKKIKGLPLSKLFGKEYIFALFVGCLISFYQQTTGVNVLTFFSSIFFSQGGYSEKIPNLMLNMSSFFFTLAVGFLVDKKGRKKLYIWGSLICSATMIILGSLYHKENSNIEVSVSSYICKVVVAITFRAGFALSHGTLCWLYIAEILPPIGTSIASSINFLLALIVGLIGPLLLQCLGGITFYIFGSITFTCFLFCIYYLPETKGKTDNEIKEIFSSYCNFIQKESLIESKSINL